MPQKLNKAGKMQDYIPKGNGDASGEYGTSNGTNKNFTTSDKKKSQANVITENKSVVVENKGKETKKDFWQEKIDKLEKTIDGLTKADAKGNKKPVEDLEKQLQDAKFNKDLVDAYKELEELEKSNNDGSLDSMIEEKKNEMKSIEKNYKEWKKTGLNVAQQENRDKENARKTQANIIDNDLTKTFGENEKYDKSYSNNPKLEEKLKSNIAEKLNEEFKGKSDEYIRQNGFTIAKGIASDEIRKDEFKDLKFNSFGSNSSNFDNMVRASLEQRKIGIKKTII